MNALTYEPCPVHGRVVAFLHGHLLGRCDACIAEAARALARLSRMTKPDLHLGARV